MNHQVVTDYTDVNTNNSSVHVYVRARPPDPNLILQDDEASVEDKFQNPLQATLAGLSPKSNSGGLSQSPSTTTAAFISNFPDNPKKICIKDPSVQGHSKHHGETYFSFDRVFWTECSQEQVFQSVAKPQVDNILNGFNGCCFAYGQTGSGKTYSMFGQGVGNSRGLIPRCMEEVFDQLERRSKDKEIAVVVSFLEIYCDRVRDLGEAYMSHGERTTNIESSRATGDVHRHAKSTRSWKQGSSVAGVLPTGGGNGGVWDSYLSMDLKIHEDMQGNVFVKDLSLIPVTTLEEVMEIISLGLKVRATHETKMNQVSSRSHTVFNVTVVQRDPLTDQTITGMLNLVDLAGSERLKKSASEGQRKTEALHINSSLTALGKVVMALDPSSGLTHIPYRDSKLTRLLQNSLGGNSFTAVLATVHPVARFSDECLSTLQFANRCRSVHNNPRVNKLGDGSTGDQRKLKKLQDEIISLRMKLGNLGTGASGKDPNARVMTVLAQMGLEGVSRLPNGAILLPDGRVVGEFGLDEEGNCYDDGNGWGGDLGEGRDKRSAYVDKIIKDSTPSVQILVRGLEDEVRAARNKLQERKKELAQAYSQVEAREVAAAERHKDWKKRETELAEQVAIGRARLSQVQSMAARTKKEHLSAVLMQNQALLRRQRRVLLRAAGKEGGEDDHLQQQEARVYEDWRRREEAARHEQTLRTLEFSEKVEVENLKQNLEELVRAETRARASVEAKLERCMIRRDREIREYSMELLMLHDYAALLCGAVIPGRMATASPPGEGLTPAGRGKKVATRGVITEVVIQPTLLASESLPRLTKLLKERGGQNPNGTVLSPSKTAAAALENGERSVCRTPAQARPQSAGNRSATPGLAPAFSHDPTVPGGGRAAYGTSQKRLVRPLSAPEKLPTKETGGLGELEEGHQATEAVKAGRAGGEEALVGWAMQDLLTRGASDLTRNELLSLLETLRRRVDGNSGVDQDSSDERRPCPAEQSLAATKDGEPRNYEPEERRFIARDLLREQARRYNDLRVAYESVSRSLQNNGGRCNVRNAVVGTSRGARSTRAFRIESLNLRARSQPELHRGATKTNPGRKSRPIRGQWGGSDSAIEPAILDQDEGAEKCNYPPNER